MTIANNFDEKNSNVGKIRNHGFSLVEVLMVTLIIIVLAAIGIPSLISMVRGLRTGGDARDLNGLIIQAKMRASSNFSRTRVYADLSANTFRIETQPSGTTGWTTDCPSGCNQSLSRGVSFGFGSLSSPPANTQSALAQAAACQDSSNNSISNTACIIFNSRGIPITPGAGPAPTGEDAIYVTDGKSVTGVTVAITGLSRVWRTDASAANWQKQ
jgi:prepilin-type N-terminal cleavage/methylation domain-containing protein